MTTRCDNCDAPVNSKADLDSDGWCLACRLVKCPECMRHSYDETGEGACGACGYVPYRVGAATGYWVELKHPPRDDDLVAMCPCGMPLFAGERAWRSKHTLYCRPECKAVAEARWAAEDHPPAQPAGRLPLHIRPSELSWETS